MNRTIIDPRSVDARLREKYDVRGPRYTSYPTAPHFHEQPPAPLAARWAAQNEQTDDPGLCLYIHVPFCKSRCLFCGCNILLGGTSQRVEDYLDTLEQEMRLSTNIIDATREVREVHLGGGTPNYLDVEQTNRLVRTLRTKFAISDQTKWSVEVDPRTATPEKLDAFLDNGFTRFSLGVQDLHEKVLEVVYRNQAALEVEEVVNYLRAKGVDEINLDLIYGLPTQTLETAEYTLSGVKALRPNRIALYSYAHVPWLMKHQAALEKHGIPNADEKIELYMYTAHGLIEAGYVPVGMDHFALPDDSLVKALEVGKLRRTFMGYTTGRGLDTLGLGVSAISWVGSSFTQNHKNLEAWRTDIEAGAMPWTRGILLNQEDEIRREVITELSCNNMVDLMALDARFPCDVRTLLADSIAALRPLEDDGLVVISQDRIEVTDLGRFFVRIVCMTFDQYLEGDASKRRYSRTV